MATDLDARCERIIATFNQAASGYDNEALRFFVFCADRLVRNQGQVLKYQHHASSRFTTLLMVV